MPVGELDQLDRGDVGPQALDVPLPHVFFGACVEEDRVSFVSFYSCLRKVSSNVKKSDVVVGLTIIKDKP